MSFWIMLCIMLVSGLVGGIVNYLLPGNNPEPGKFLKPLLNCIVLGLGATLLVPLFLEIAQSKLMDDIRFDIHWTDTSKVAAVKTDTMLVKVAIDSAGKLKSDTVYIKSGTKAKEAEDAGNSGKHYLLWSAYCLLAAAAGFRFINMLINNVVKEDQLNKVKSEKEELEKEKEKRIKNSQISQQKEDRQVREKITFNTLAEMKDAGIKTGNIDKIADLPVLPALLPVSHPDDPQKGRFGGRAENNGRRLRAEVGTADLAGYYPVTLVVESTDGSKPLDTDVVFYLHDSFSPSVYTITPEEFDDEQRAVDDEILSYGAFTVGVITDKGKTLLELDLAEDKTFPKEFRER
ncbi:MAG: YEATS-associated helix-containing protein [Ferruginibacter sp.]